MPHTDQIRLLADVPDHGFGLLGGLAHSVLAEYAGAAPVVPCLHLGQNTLPNPPLELAASVSFGDLSQGWRECGSDLAAFLATGARSLRAQPTPAAGAFSQPVRIVQRLLRFDSIALAWPGWALLSGHAADDADGPADGFCGALPEVIAVAVDRASNALYGWVPQAGSTTDIQVTGDGLTASDPIVALLRDVLLAQYEWTSSVFGLVP
jgi:hypothetical protein